MNPTFLPPIRKRLGGTHLEEIHSRVSVFRRKLGSFEPGLRKLVTTISHVLAAKNTKMQHLSRRKFRREFRVKTLTRKLRQEVAIPLLHLVIDNDFFGLHLTELPDVIRRGFCQKQNCTMKRRFYPSPKASKAQSRKYVLPLIKY